MSNNSSQTRVSPPCLVAILLERAERLSRHEDLTVAQPLFAAAIVNDPTPVARMAYAVQLAKYDPDAAIAEFEIAWAQSRRLDQPHLRANCCQNLAILFRSTGNPAVADQFRQLAISAELETANTATGSMISPALSCEIAFGWLSCGDVDSAERMLASAACQANGEGIAERIIVESHRGVVASMCCDEAKAEQHLLKAFRLCREDGDWWASGRLQVNLGHLSQFRREFDQASRRFRVAAELFRLVGDHRLARMASALEREANARWRLGSACPQWN